MGQPGSDDQSVVDAQVAPSHTPGPWEYVPSTEHHGAYITSIFGSTIADFYVMSQPGFSGALSGGPVHPVHFMSEMANPNARLAAAAPEMLAMLRDVRDDYPDNSQRRHIDALIAKATEAS